MASARAQFRLIILLRLSCLATPFASQTLSGKVTHYFPQWRRNACNIATPSPACVRLAG
jgi:hypothetical protein